MQATYSPDDDTLRLRSSTRLDEQTYQRVGALGFKFAPQQRLFFARGWTPAREDLLLELCGEIEDEDTSLLERAEVRASRFEGYGANRTADADRSRAGVAAVADHIPFGQPVLAGHHSEARARRDAARIEKGMRDTVRLWKQAAYWQERAAAARRHAEYRLRPDVRARRISRLEADHRKWERTRKRAQSTRDAWLTPANLTQEAAKAIASAFSESSFRFPLDQYPRQPGASQYEGLVGLWGALEDRIITPEQARGLAVDAAERQIAGSQRWIDHLTNRLAYERAMLDDQGGLPTDRTAPEKGGACQYWASPRGGGWSYIVRVNRVSVTVNDNFGNGGRTFTRTVKHDEIKAVMTAADVQAARDAGRLLDTGDGTGFYLKPPAVVASDLDDRTPSALSGEAGTARDEPAADSADPGEQAGAAASPSNPAPGPGVSATPPCAEIAATVPAGRAAQLSFLG